MASYKLYGERKNFRSMLICYAHSLTHDWESLHFNIPAYSRMRFLR